MLEDLYKIPEVSAFLAWFPRDQWRSCIEVSIILGIKWVFKRFPNGCTFNQLKLEANFSKNKANISQTRKSSTEVKYKPSRNSFSNEKISDNLIDYSPKELMKHAKTMNQQKVPSHLRYVSSKIKNEVHKDIALYKIKMNSSRNSLVEKSTEIEKMSSGVQTERTSELPINAIVDFVPQGNNEDVYFSPTGPLKEKNRQKSHKHHHKHQKKMIMTEGIKEPNTISIEDAQNIFIHLPSGKNSPLQPNSGVVRSLDLSGSDKSVMEIADKFLSNPMASYLAKDKGTSSGFNSPKFLERLFIPNSNPISRTGTASPSYLAEL
ncbi:unnamed protein product [Blepharisma stoltei]|uniref:Uncharacterized protein n=1 Tax=Blepharisma stoltei TaxID=1481888 RepID=A0AAU9JNC1_9CILI|nr:unnamed protein product [Blepharisma stoltei]